MEVDTVKINVGTFSPMAFYIEKHSLATLLDISFGLFKSNQLISYFKIAPKYCFRIITAYFSPVIIQVAY